MEQIVGFPPGHGPLKRTAEEISDVPAPHRDFNGDLQGSHTGQGSTAQNVHIPAPHRDFNGDLQGFHTGQGSTAQNVDIPVPGGVPEDTHVPGSIEWVQLSDDTTRTTHLWNRRTQATVWKPPPGVRVVRYTSGTRTPTPEVLSSLLWPPG